MYETNLSTKIGIFCCSAPESFALSAAGQAGNTAEPGCKFRSRPGSMARALGVQVAKSEKYSRGGIPST